MSHCIQLEASASGSHTGATLPSSVIAISGLMLLGGATRPGAGGIASVAAAARFSSNVLQLASMEIGFNAIHSKREEATS